MINNSLEILTERIDTIERLLKMLLVNSLIDELDDVAKENNSLFEKEIPGDVIDILNKYNMSVFDVVAQNGFILVYIDTQNAIKPKIVDYRVLNRSIREIKYCIIPVFQFEYLNGMQRKKFIESNISFSINDKELHICGQKNKNTNERE